MSRPIDLASREKHATAMDALLRMLAGLEVTIKAGERIGQLQEIEAHDTINTARKDLEGCGQFESQILKRIRDDFVPNHLDVEQWLTDLSLDLMLLSTSADLRAVEPRPITLERLAEGKRLVQGLARCRESLVFYR